jgi:hypothetical protein
MGSTLTRQWRKYPSSGNTRLGDGDPLHSAMNHDLIDGVNNLHYTQPFAGFVAAPTTDGVHEAIYADPPMDGLEVFAAQVPTVVPSGMTRFCWTLGLYASYEEDGTPRDMSIDEVNIYFAPALYRAQTNGFNAPTVSTGYAFDIDQLGGLYGVSSYSAPLSFPGLDADLTYGFIDMSAGTDAYMPFENKLDGGTSNLNCVGIIVTMRLSGEAGWAGHFRIWPADFSFQWLME